MKKLNWGRIFEKLAIKHGDFYDYYIDDQGDYISTTNNMVVTCPLHGKFTIRIANHLSGRICSECNAEKTRINKEIKFIKDSKLLHGDTYGYDMIHFTRMKDNVKIYCNIHEEYFLQTPARHLMGRGCQKCGGTHIKTTEDFIRDGIKLYDDAFTYEYVNYISAKIHVKITCVKHGVFEQTPDGFLSGNGFGCKDCLFEHKQSSRLSNWDDVLSECVIKHDGYFGYNRDKQPPYEGQTTKMIVTCPSHGDFPVSVANHKNHKRGCPRCKESYGEIIIREYLNSVTLTHCSQYRYDNCRGDTKPLSFDFYLPELNILIEYDGVQHFEYDPDFFHKKGYWQFERQQRYDEVKNQYCRDNNIDLLRIPYYENTIEVLENYLAKFL